MIEIIQPANEQDWLALRNKDITSTKVSALFGISPYLTKFELWHQITRGEVVEFEENQRMKWGNRLQDSIAAGIAEEQGWNVRKMTEYIRDTDLRAGSSFDFAIDEDGILEIKNVDGLVYRNSWEENSAPLHIELQVQHQLMVSGRKYAYIGALVGGNDLKLIRRERDEVVIESIRKAIKEFWLTIENNTPPEPDFQADAEFLSKIYGFSEPGKLFDARGDDEIRLLAEEYKKLGDVAKDAENKRDAIKAELLTKIQDAEKVTGDGFSISAGMVGECPINYIRKAYRLFKISWKKIAVMLLFCTTLSYADDSKAIMTVIYESRGESFEGQVAVASVIKTRAYIKNKTSEQIVTKPYQFSCWNKEGKPVQKHTPTSGEIETALRAWKVAEIGVYTNYYATWIKPPSWSSKCTQKKTIGRHVFCHLDNF